MLHCIRVEGMLIAIIKASVSRKSFLEDDLIYKDLIEDIHAVSKRLIILIDIWGI